MIDRSHLDKGEFVIFELMCELMCESCTFNTLGPLNCKKYINRKPNEVLKCTSKCSEYNMVNNVSMAGIIGAVVGDALGVPVEFTSREKLSLKHVIDMNEYGTHNQPKGTWSDDSSLILALIAGLREREYNLQSIANKFVQWYEKGKYTPYGQVFDIGNSTLDAIERIKSGISPEKAGGETEYDNGNGSLMRILPLAFYLYHETDIEKRVKIIYELSSLTHRHIRSKVACHIYVEIAIKLINGQNILDAYKEVCSMLNEYYEEKLESKEKVIFKRILDGQIYKYSVDEIKSSGYVIHTLEAALWCLLTTNNYKDSVLEAVNLGDDTDTTGAVTGGLAGILYGLDNIPKDWIEDLGNGIMIFNSANQLYKKCFNNK